MTTPAWSYSSLTLFDQCPRKYYHLRVVKDIVEPESESMRYGNELHKAAELHIKDGVALPPQFKFVQPYMEKVKAIPGNKLTEHKLGLRIDGGKIVPCGFFAKDVWFRGVIDLLSLDNMTNVGYVIDYKTGKSSQYADDLQLELMASLVFLHFGQIHKIKAGLMFVVAKDFVTRKYEMQQKLTVFSKLDNILQRREKAYETGVFNPKQNFTCRGYCPVMSCPHNGRRG